MALSRKQSQEDTRRKLLDCAIMLAAEGGINAMSIRAICRAAGMTQGAFYANFSSKDDLLAVLMQLHLNREIDALQALTEAGAGQPLAEVVAELGAHFASLSQNRAWSLLSVELQVHALRDPDFAERYDANNADYLKALAGIIEALIARHDLRPALPVPQLAASLHALWTGLIVQSRHDDVPGETLLLRIFSELVKTDPALLSRT